MVYICFWILCIAQAEEVLRQLRGKRNVTKELQEIQRDVQLSKVSAEHHFFLPCPI